MRTKTGIIRSVWLRILHRLGADDAIKAVDEFRQTVAQTNMRLEELERAVREQRPSACPLTETQRDIHILQETLRALHEVKVNGQMIRRLHYRANKLLQNTHRLDGRISVVFCVNFSRYWSSMEPIYRLMEADEGFSPLVVVVDDTSVGFGESSESLTDYLRERGVPFLRWGSMTGGEYLRNEHLLDIMSPDVVFRQTHWENVPEAFQTIYAAAYRLCYIPYGLELAGSPETFVNRDLHQAAWRIYYPSQLHVDYFRTVSMIGGRNARAVGHPRLDEIAFASAAAAFRQSQAVESARPFRVLWAPHHSVGDDWLRFGMFPKIWRDMLGFVSSNPDVRWQLREHHILYDRVRHHGAMTDAEIEFFRGEWDRFPNAERDQDHSYVSSFAASDVLLTDGLSFLAEFQVTGKPVIFLEREGHDPFTPIGERVVEGCYRVGSTEEAFALILRLKDDPTSDVLAGRRREIAAELRPCPGGSARMIVEDIRNGMKGEARDLSNADSSGTR